MTATDSQTRSDGAADDVERPRPPEPPRRYIAGIHHAGSVLAVVGGIAQQVRGQADYVALCGPAWFLILGAALALGSWWLRRRRVLSRATALAATVLLLPSVALLVFHVLRLLGAIPYPVDGLALASSAGAFAAVASLWRVAAPLRTADGSPLAPPRWVAIAGLAAAMVYPALKTFWALGGRWLAPADLRPGFDADYVVPVVFALLGALATLVALRWWNRPAPRFAHPAAVVGGLALVGLGLGGTYATITAHDAEAPLVGVLVYGGWLLWGLATLAVAARLSTRRTRGVSRVRERHVGSARS